MIKIILSLLSLSLVLFLTKPIFSQEADPGAGGAATSAADTTSPPVDMAPLFRLETAPEDSPDLARKKAALRLFKSYSVTVGLLNGCKTKAPAEAGKAASGFNSRNGSTLGTIMATLKRLGGFNPEIKTALDTAIAAEVMVGTSDCQALIKAVDGGARDIYKAPEYAEDYALMRGQQ